MLNLVLSQELIDARSLEYEKFARHSTPAFDDPFLIFYRTRWSFRVSFGRPLKEPRQNKSGWIGVSDGQLA